MSKQKWPHIDDPVALGKRLREAREQKGLSQRDLAFPGCTAVYICRIEHGDRVPSLQVIVELARRLYVSKEYLALGPEVSETLPYRLLAKVDHLFQLAFNGASPDYLGFLETQLDALIARAELEVTRLQQIAEMRASLTDSVESKAITEGEAEVLLERRIAELDA